MKFQYVSAVLVVSSAVCFAQQNRYITFFKDKVGTPYSIERPEEFLSLRALMRRARHNLSVNTQDLPPNPTYLDGLRKAGAVVYYRSRWMNASLIQTDSVTASRIRSLDYVRAVSLVAPGPKLAAPPTPEKKASAAQDSVQIRISNLPQYTLPRKQMGIENMHQEGFFGQGVWIAVLDNGFNHVNTSSYFRHIFKTKAILDTYDYVVQTPYVYHGGTHGSIVLSTMAAYHESIYKGFAPKASYALYVSEDRAGEHKIEEYNWLFAAERADSLGVDIIHSSLGYKRFDVDTMSYVHEQLHGRYAVSSLAAEAAQKRGILVVVSVGNAGLEGIVAPSDSRGALSVGAHDLSMQVAAFSSRGGSADGRLKPELSALGVHTPAILQEDIVSSSGTSLSAPLVSGLAAGLFQALPRKRNDEIAQLLLSSAHLFHQPNQNLGYGTPHFTRAIARKDHLFRLNSQSLSHLRFSSNETQALILLSALPERLSMLTFELYALRIEGSPKIFSLPVHKLSHSNSLRTSFKKCAAGEYLLMLRCKVGAQGQTFYARLSLDEE